MGYFDLISSFFTKNSSENCAIALKTLSTLYSTFRPEEIALSLNGGKDSTAVLFLTLFKRRELNITTKLKCIYMRESLPFKEILHYIKILERDFDLELHEFNSSTFINEHFMKSALKQFIEENGIRSIIAGNRSTDPHSQNLDTIQKTSSDWPEFIRALPIYYWDYRLVWNFIIENNLMYCSLYEQGYTYVGDQINTISNPFLNGKHARFGNDNIELFSRTKLYNNLERADGRIYFGKENVEFIFYNKYSVSEMELIVQRSFEQFKEYLLTRNFSFDLNIRNYKKSVSSGYFPDNTEDVFINKILELKRIPGNFSKIYLVVVFDSDDQPHFYI